MKTVQAPDKMNSPTSRLSDAEVLPLFHCDPARAWELFIERYADVILAYLRRLGGDYDQTMDRFVYVCEKLCEENFRRLRMIQYAGSNGNLTPWVRRVVEHLCTDWARSANGRKRVFKCIARLPARAQRIFELYFWKGLSPPEIYEQLRLCDHDLDFTEVFDVLEHIFSHLNQKKLWCLITSLARRRGAVSLNGWDEEIGIDFDPVDARPNPEEALIQKEAEEQVKRALDGLSLRERLMIQAHYEKEMTVKEMAETFCLSEQEVKSTLKAALRKLRGAVK